MELETARKLFGGTAGGPGLFGRRTVDFLGGRAKTPEESSTHIVPKTPALLGKSKEFSCNILRHISHSPKPS